MHGAGVIGEEKVARSQFGDELLERGPTDQVAVLPVEFAQDFIGDPAVLFRAQNDPLAITGCSDLANHRSEVLGKPALRGTVFGARAKAEQRQPGNGPVEVRDWVKSALNVSTNEPGEFKVAMHLVTRGLRARVFLQRFFAKDLI